MIYDFSSKSDNWLLQSANEITSVALTHIRNMKSASVLLLILALSVFAVVIEKSDAIAVSPSSLSLNLPALSV